MTASRQLTSIRGSSATAFAARARSASARRSSCALSGLPGLSSHHTRSSFKRLIANRLMARCAACGGLKEPPSKPTRMPLLWSGIACAALEDATATGFNAMPPTRSRPRLPGPVHAVFEAGELLGADGAAGVEFASGNADLGAEAELAAIGKLRRGIMQHDRRVHLVEEFLRGRRILGHDRVGVARAVILDVRDRFIDAVDHARGDDRVQILGVPVLV